MLASMQKAVAVSPVEYQWEGVVRKPLALVFVRETIGVGPTAIVEYVVMQERTWQIC
jgi:hypothetical protein